MCLNFGKLADFTAAIDFVTEYDANNAKLDITRQRQNYARVEEPMDISAINQRHAKPPPKPQDDISEMRRQVSGLTNQFTKLMASLKNTQQASPRPQNNHSQTRRPQSHSSHNQYHSTSQNDSFNFTDDGRPICAFCNKPGHVQRHCRSRLAAQRQSQGSRSRSAQGDH